MSALEVRDLYKRFGKVETLKGIDISLDNGEFLVLLGASGCGKSTLLNIIAGLTEPSSGDVLIGGRSVVGVHPKNRDIAMVFQSYALYPNMSVARNIGFGLEIRKVPQAQREKAIHDAARLLQIEDLLDRRPAELSGGQRQRVAIGRALVRNPQIFLFDEPLSNLDAKLRMEMRVELKRLHEKMKTTVVYVTHDQIEAMTLATRIAVMRDGRIEQIGTPEEIYNRPATLYVAGFVGAPPMNLLDATMSDGGLHLAGCTEAIAIPSRLKGSLAESEPVCIGIRPERLRLADPAQPGQTIKARIELIEMTGPELVVMAKVGDQRLTACLPPGSSIANGTERLFAFDEDALHLFDPKSQRAVLNMNRTVLQTPKT
ncbi:MULTISPECIES: ABC transporter ATP-binding protein [Alphaproteobacteria]|uniref:Sugar ABC transporter ATP-binding protein n=2 Tax=Alphaproteobacteria TaxID=28211 RepID=A0A512HLE1_9HYPH|nr:MULTISPECIES: sn-glycerol-3-phosphate ABC transporter ATP-binding protein UgpC [Alphaproteobacteria]GEO86264.1 sugar ABC transporter ATP-binding protein [Ciceribacter naphthalenivorans]GLR21358.1 sugar ABC transporter ATP-binding protein [Ciceribacter naphthalenivorans]GLT04214.1 sugar ABC transporter ATP-binding protein [Sphingomonas psychrolutea]